MAILKYRDKNGNFVVLPTGSGGSSVEWNQIQTSGTKIAEVTIEGTKKDVFAPNGGVGSGIVVDTLIDATITTTDSYDFSASIDNYDMLLVTGMTHINSSDYEQLNSLIIMKDDYYIEAVDGWSHSLNFSINGSTRRAVFNFNDGKLNVVKIENAALKKIYGIKFITQQHNYSTEEQIVGTWVNGKPLYERVFNLNISQKLGTGAYINTDIDCSYMDKIIEYSLIGTYSGNGITENCSFMPYNVLKWTNNKIHIAFSNFNDGGIFNIEYMILKYTKTTD